MNPEQLLNAVETCVTERRPSNAKTFVICWKDAKLQCLPSPDVIDDGNIFVRFNVDELAAGLTAEQWGNVAKKITTFFKIKK